MAIIPRTVTHGGFLVFHAAATFTFLIASLPCSGQGTITTAAGTGTPGFSGDGGPATKAEIGGFGRTLGVAVDKAGNLHIVDGANNRIRKVDAAGIITTVAGGGSAAGSGDGGPATKAQIFPGGAVFDSAGNLYFAQGATVRKVDTLGILTTVAGNGNPAFGGDGGPALQAGFLATNVAVDGAGNIYIADSTNARIRKVDKTGTITTVAGSGVQGFAGDGGPAAKASLFLPQGLAADHAGNLYFADNGTRVRKVSTSGVITTVAGDGTPIGISDGVQATKTGMTPTWVAVDTAGNLFICDTGGSRIRKVNSSGIIHTVAGSLGPFGFSGDGGPATKAQLFNPTGVTVDGAGNIYIADTNNFRVRKVSSGSSSTTGGPVVTAALNAATFAAGEAIAPGSLASLFGTGLAKATSQASSIPLPVSLGGVSVTIGGIPAPLIFVSAKQINLQVPWTVQPGTVDIVVTVNGSVAAVFHATAGALSPGIFSTQFGTGQAIAINLDGSLVAMAGAVPGATSHPAKVGDTIIILGTGLGEVTPVIATGAAASDALRTTTTTPKVLIGGVQAKVSFSGLSPQFVGVNQLNVVVPSVSSGVVSLQIEEGGILTTNKVTIAVTKP